MKAGFSWILYTHNVSYSKFRIGEFARRADLTSGYWLIPLRTHALWRLPAAAQGAVELDYAQQLVAKRAR